VYSQYNTPRDQEEEEAMAMIQMTRATNGSRALRRETTLHTMDPVLYCLAVSTSPAEALDEAWGVVNEDDDHY
jgi:hypothetical protein